MSDFATRSFVLRHVRLAGGWVVAAAVLGACHPAADRLGSEDPCADKATRISAVQGTGAVSPLAGRPVTVDAVVTAVHPGLGGFFIQEEDTQADSDPATSEGLFVFSPDGAGPIRPGDRVRVSGTVAETGGLTRLADVSDVVGCGPGGPVTPAVPGSPVPAAFPDVDAYYERFESMSVRYEQALTVTGLSDLGRYGHVWLSSGGRLVQPGQDGRFPLNRAGFEAAALEQRRRSVILDDANARQNRDPVFHPVPGGFSVDDVIRVGDTVTHLRGVLDYRFDTWLVQPLPDHPPVFRSAGRPAPPPRTGRLRVAALNVLNFFNGDGRGGGFPTARGAHSPAELRRQTAKLVRAVTALDADVLGLMELENDGDGPDDSLAALVDAVNTDRNDATWAAIAAGRSGGDDAIRTALIYRRDRVSPQGPPAVLSSPSFTDPLDHGDALSRPALVQTFRVTEPGRPDTGESMTVVVVHLKSKGSPCGPGDDDPVQGNCNGTRAGSVRALLTDPVVSDRPRVAVVGDFNSYRREDPMQALADAGWVNALPATAHTYVYAGRSGALDHIVVSPGLAPALTGAMAWHINADESALLDYNDAVADPGEAPYQVKPATRPLYRPDPYRSSDHDPVVADFDLEAARTADSGGSRPAQ